MLLSLIAVLVLLVIAFYALWMAITGRIGGGDKTELSAGGRVIIGGVALMAFGIAYAAYHPIGQAGAAAAVEASAADLASPPAVTETAMATPQVRANPMPVARSAEANPDEDASAAAEEPSQKIAAPASADATEKTAEDRGGLSESAAAMEAAATRSPARPVVAPVFRSQVSSPVAESARVAEPSAAPAEPAARPRAGRPAEVVAGTSLRRPRRAVLIHIDNALGDDQQSEQLTLSIEGKRVADIDIDGQQPAVSVAVSLPRPGRLFYRLEGLSGDGVGTRVKGEGCIRVDDGARYVVRRKPGTRKLSLERQRAAR